MKLLFITQKLHGQDAFGALWVREFIRQGHQVTVLCLEGSSDMFEFPVHSMGKEKGSSKLLQIMTFERAIVSLPYDRVFIHMAPVWYALGFWWWLIKRVPTYLWYTHYTMQLGVRLFGWWGTRFFAATEQSLPMFSGSPKKVVIGHGIDLPLWQKRQNQCDDPRALLAVHRLSRSKRVELSLKALTLLDSSYTLDIYGIEAEKDYVQELHQLVQELKLSNRVTFHGSAPMNALHEIYAAHTLILNMASETIDKTMLEAMTCGCYPVTTMRNARSIGLVDALKKSKNEDLLAAPAADTPEAIASFIVEHSGDTPLNADEMYEVVRTRHSLVSLIEKMCGYMERGE
ncbi:MAG: glycosyltransferase family 4 protein [Candidatus Peribacteraceae bacterium]